MTPPPQHTLTTTILAALLLAAPHATHAQTTTPQPAAAAQTRSPDSGLIADLVSRYGERLIKSRYMEKNCKPVSWPGWEGLPTQKCRYPVTDRATSTTKYAEVVMLNAPPEKVARWVVTAVHDAGSTQPAADADKLFRHILGQSGGQFPIAGVVYEDMEGDGLMKAYAFRNGVTVRVAGLQHRTTHTLTPAEITASLTGPVERVYTYAGIASTTPGQYKAAGGTLDVGTNSERKPAWLDAVADQYRRAWTSDRNELISAWARANL
jgi:hypothetical protein